jgi:hypothetical protein|tara:strand:+ start:705 stop:1385 length:681 start_codon:yes stop_codon:yes gene_type:complete
MEEGIQNAIITQTDAESQWRGLLNLIPENTFNGDLLREAITSRMNTSLSVTQWKKKKELADQLEVIKSEMPGRILGLMNTLAEIMDEEEDDADRWRGVLQDHLFGADNPNSLMECVADLLFISNHTEISRPKKDYANGKKRLTRAETLARASDPDDRDYGFCPKCNRPMLMTTIPIHQKNTTICVEIKSGKVKAVELGKAKDKTIGRHIAEQVFMDPNDSADEDDQ